MKVDPCPFCGNKDPFVNGYVKDGFGKEIKMFMFISCRNCGASGPSQECTAGNLDECMERAINAWNYRRNNGQRILAGNR